MTPFQDLTEYTTNDIQALIDNNAEESIHLDFKAAQALEKSEKKKDEIAKDVSSFANSDGGIIIYGISEKNHHAHSLSFIDGSIYTKEWLEQVINSKINKRIEGVQIFPVRFEDKLSNSVYVVKIPRSDNAPHMSSDRHYYRRFNFVSVPMEEYEVRDSILRLKKTKLEIVSYYLIKADNNSDDRITYSYGVGIKNVGNQVEKVFKVNTVFMVDKDIFHFLDFNWEPAKDNINYYVDDGYVVISGVGLAPIFPGEKIDLCRFKLELEPEAEVKFRDEAVLKMVLFFSGGKDEIEVRVSDLLRYSDES